MANYVEFYQVMKTFPTPTGPQVIVEDFNLNIAQGEFVSLIGHSGCGKSMSAERIAKEKGYARLAVISAIGTRKYYLDRGFKRGEWYLVKQLTEN